MGPPKAELYDSEDLGAREPATLAWVHQRYDRRERTRYL